MNALLADNVRVALGGLLANRLRSSLTMLGVIIGVAAVVALLSIGQGATAAITDQISSAGTNLLFVSPGSSDRGPVRGAPGSAATLTYEDAEAIADPLNMSGVTAVAPEFSQNAQVIFGESNTNGSVIGTVPEYLAVYGLDVASGRFVEDQDVDRRATIAILGSQVAEDLFGGFDPVGQKIKVAQMDDGAKKSLTIVGVLEEQGGSMISNPDDAVFVPISTAQYKLFDGRNVLGDATVSRISVVAGSEDAVESVEVQITNLLTVRHELGAEEDADFSIMSQAEMLDMADEVSGTLSVFLGAIAGISLLVGGIGIMNIMLVSVTERTREVGLRKAVGARRADILSQFLLEAIVLSVMGGILGVLAGLGVAKLVDVLGWMRAVPSPLAALLALCAALAVGVFFGIYPANRAAALSPIEALRYE